MLLLVPSLRYALGGNFPSAAQSEGAAATELFHVWAALGRLKTISSSLSRGHSAHWPLWVGGSISKSECLAGCFEISIWFMKFVSVLQEFIAGGWTLWHIFIWKLKSVISPVKSGPSWDLMDISYLGDPKQSLFFRQYSLNSYSIWQIRKETN